MQKTTTRWGILGTAQIARKNWLSIRNSGNGVVAAVASRQLASAARFIDECQARQPFPQKPRAVGSYAELLAAPDIDAVYVPLPTTLRKEWVIAAANAGKHVVCEKPCAATVTDLAEMLAACREHHVQFMDGVMFMHSRRLELVRQAINENVGRLRRLTLAFSFNAPAEFLQSNIRANSTLEPLGCVGDLAWYCIRFALWTVDWQMPQAVSGRILTPSQPPPGLAPVPLEFSGELLFAGGISAGFYASFLTENQQLAQVAGERGLLRLTDFVLPFLGAEAGFETFNSKFVTDSCCFTMAAGARRWTVPEYSNSHPTAQETNLFRNFAAQIQTGQLNAHWPDHALKTQQVMEQCLAAART